jgi:hypothetical protein
MEIEIIIEENDVTAMMERFFYGVMLPNGLTVKFTEKAWDKLVDDITQMRKDQIEGEKQLKEMGLLS